MLLCTCLALNPHVTRHAKYFSVSSMSSLYYDHRMNLPCDAITVLMVITCVLIYLCN